MNNTMMHFNFDRISVGAIFPWKGFAIAAISLMAGPGLLHTDSAHAAALGDSATVVNTFEDATITGGLQTLFGIAGPETITNDVEFPDFIGFYDTDISDTSLSLTLVDNSGAADLVLTENRFDRYYFGLDTSIITSASLDGTDELNAFANVEVLEAGFSLDAADVFGTGIPAPIEFENGGLLVEFGEGTDLTNLGVSAKVNFTSESITSKSVPESQTAVSVLLVGGLMFANSIARQRRVL